MIIVIWSTSKHSWWWLLRINPCSNILDDVDWYFINVQAYLMMTIWIWSMYKHPWWWSSRFNTCLKTIFLKKWPKFGHDDNWNWSHDQFLLKVNKIWSRWHLELVTWPIFGKIYQNLVVMTIGIGCMTNYR